ncbi:hypothetical protein MBLNU457_7379t1 [Dothideomycetes sp. NU457]
MAEEPVNALFRPSKRRKTFRKRAGEDEEDIQSTEREDAHRVLEDKMGQETVIEDDKTGDTTQTRRPAKPRRVGVNFSSAPSPRPKDQTSHTTLARIEPAQDATPTAVGRFTAPTGQAVQKEDKHMMAYIDAQMANMPSERVNPINKEALLAISPEQQQPGKGQSQITLSHARLREVEEVDVQVTGDDGKVTRVRKERVRLGRDGKPLPPRKKRYERTAEDVARDAMVERLLSENRFENVYTSPSSDADRRGDSSQAGLDEDADARMADEFRREFIATAEENKARRQVGGAKATDMSKGPKMGGSKNQRAAAEKEKNKSTK